MINSSICYTVMADIGSGSAMLQSAASDSAPARLYMYASPEVAELWATQVAERYPPLRTAKSCSVVGFDCEGLAEVCKRVADGDTFLFFTSGAPLSGGAVMSLFRPTDIAELCAQLQAEDLTDDERRNAFWRYLNETVAAAQRTSDLGEQGGFDGQ